MRIDDAVITKEYWEPIFGQISACFENAKYEQVSDQLYKMHFDNFLVYVAAKDHGEDMEVFGWLVLEPRWQAYEVAQSFVFKWVRGEGWGKFLYGSVIEDGVMLASGDQQTKTGRGIWKALVKSDRFHIWAHDFKNLNRYADVIYDKEEDELYSRLKIYTKKMTQREFWAHQRDRGEDIRLIAMRKE